MTPDEVLAVIRERVKKWRDFTKNASCTIYSVSPYPGSGGCSSASAGSFDLTAIYDDLDPDRIDAAGKMRRDLINDLCGLIPAVGHWPEARDVADALLAKGWRK